MKAKKIEPRFNYYYDWSDFSIGLSIAKPHNITGWNFVIAIDFTFFGFWVYFNKSKV